MVTLQENAEIGHGVIQRHQLLQLVGGHNVCPIAPKTMSWRTDESCIHEERITKEGKEESVCCPHSFIVEAIHEYQVCPQGPTNAPAMFQSFMNDILREYLDLIAVGILDDIIIFSESLEEHI